MKSLGLRKSLKVKAAKRWLLRARPMEAGRRGLSSTTEAGIAEWTWGKEGQPPLGLWSETYRGCYENLP